ncbi:hypothetical protein B0H16DRAFT_523432 [Mycena metata]|uniref:Uncharacterized protein n=1 Tax=Mycena metata TaxID=1033252 RepID=A0AAD7H883_9AGAR|nr:hypothetical protein B0H16DRAFT_523432 [Mycena metata]
MNEFIGTHVTRTPVGTPGPTVPGAFPTHLESESHSSTPSVTAANAQDQASALLASAPLYLPSLEQAKAYLPQGVATYLPPSPSTASAPVDVGHGATVPYTASAPEPYRQDTNSSSTVNVGHGATVPYTESIPIRRAIPNVLRHKHPLRPGARWRRGILTLVPQRTRPQRTRATPRPLPASRPPRPPPPTPTAPHAHARVGAPFLASRRRRRRRCVHAQASPRAPWPSIARAGGAIPRRAGAEREHRTRAGGGEVFVFVFGGGGGGVPAAGRGGRQRGGPRATSSSSSSAGGRPTPASGLLASHPAVASSSSSSVGGRPTPNPDLLPSHPAAGA